MAAAAAGNPAFLELWQVAEAIQAGAISARAVVEACLERVRAHDGKLNAFRRLEAEAALAAADTADADLKRGRLRGALHGVPLAHKDMFYRAGRVASCGSKIRADFVPAVTSTALARLDAAGALNLGSLNMAEFAFNPTGHNIHHGPVGNPWNPAHITGGSSSGSGAAVAARFCYGALGSDTGGSIRLPAAICGVTGIKPTWGRVSRAGAMPLSWSLDTIGPLARSAKDCAILLGLMAGPDPADATAAARPVPDYTTGIDQPLKGLRIGVARDFLYDGIKPEIEAALSESLRVYRDLGASVVDVVAPHLHDIRALVGVIMFAEAANIHAKWLRERPDDYTPVVRQRLESGLMLPASTYLDALRLRPILAERFCAEVFARCDVLHAPVLFEPVPTIAQSDVTVDPRHSTVIPRNTRIVNYLGLPGLSVPCGFDANGLPIGHQLVGPAFAEGLLFRTGHAFQGATDWHQRLPPL
ncbi:MAG: amidase [Alphaproteobacteria bacterium]|nr:amidase [Alphaproteobacteria bacterium]